MFHVAIQTNFRITHFDKLKNNARIVPYTNRFHFDNNISLPDLEGISFYLTLRKHYCNYTFVESLNLGYIYGTCLAVGRHRLHGCPTRQTCNTISISSHMRYRYAIVEINKNNYFISCTVINGNLSFQLRSNYVKIILLFNLNVACL